MNTAEWRSTVEETITNCLEERSQIEIPRKHSIEFWKLKILYQKQIAAKAKQLKEEIVPASYRALVKGEYLKRFIAAWCFRAHSIEELTKQQKQQFEEDCRKSKADGEHFQLVEQVVRGISMKIYIGDGEGVVWTLHREYRRTLQMADYDDVPYPKPQLAIPHITKKLKPQHLYRRTTDII